MGGHPSRRRRGIGHRNARPPWEEAVTAIVVLRPGATLDTPLIRAWARDRIAGYKMPKVVHALEALPLNATGKVDQ
ncbi:MAG: AMP-binding enzyme [Sphingobium sp.]